MSYSETEHVSIRQLQTEGKFNDWNYNGTVRLWDEYRWVMFMWLMSNVWEPRQAGPEQPKICPHFLPAAIDLSFELALQDHFYKRNSVSHKHFFHGGSVNLKVLLFQACGSDCRNSIYGTSIRETVRLLCESKRVWHRLIDICQWR